MTIKIGIDFGLAGCDGGGVWYLKMVPLLTSDWRPNLG